MTREISKLALFLPLAATLALAAPAALAQEHHDHDRGFHGHGYYGRDFHSFSPHERFEWEHGHWDHGWHDGRYAWWWGVGPDWYFYPQPMYPYPAYVPPAVVVQQAPPQPTGLPPAQYWYYCDNPQGYYPYVASCNSAWRSVPATPAK